MSEIQTLTAQARVPHGKGQLRRARGQGHIPAIIYGASSEPTPITLEEKVVGKILRQGGFLATQFNIELDGKKHHVLPRAVQFHPVTERLLHLDFMRVSAKTKTHVMVRVVFINEDSCLGLKRGGLLNVVRHEVELVCAVSQIPDHLEVDLQNCDIGDSIHMSQIGLPSDVQPAISDRDFTIATVAAPTVATEVTPSEEATQEEAADEGEQKEE